MIGFFGLIDLIVVRLVSWAPRVGGLLPLGSHVGSFAGCSAIKWNSVLLLGFFSVDLSIFFSALQQDQDVFTLWLHFEYSSKDLHRGCFSPA